MGREVRRVPLDFDWPLGEVWEGFLLPKGLRPGTCEFCAGDGMTVAARSISHTFYPHMIVHAGAFPGAGEHADRLAWCDKIGQTEVDNLLANGRLRTLVSREPTEDNPRDREWVSLPRTAAEVNAAQRRRGFEGHDAINQAILVRFRCQVLGIPLHCEWCDGHGFLEAYPGQRGVADAWKASEPPEGEGWQLWETVSEGSPVSPVFPDAEALAQWLTTPVGGDAIGPSGRPMTIEQARGFVAAGWAPSFVGNAGGLHDGATFVGTDAALGGSVDTP